MIYLSIKYYVCHCQNDNYINSKFMPNLKDLTKLYNSSCKLMEQANELATIIRYTVDDVSLMQEFTETGKKLLALDRDIKIYALTKTDELSEKSKSLN